MWMDHRSKGRFRKQRADDSLMPAAQRVHELESHLASASVR